MDTFQNNTDTLDQHFLINYNTINKVINLCNLTNKDTILEIGPGKGTLTRIINSKVKELYIIEKDVRLKPYLIDYKNVTYNDCLKVEFPKVDKIITSLPYSIIEPFIYKIIRCSFKELYMIMGNNYIDNVIAGKISNLSLLTNTFFDVEKLLDIPKEDFNPVPRTKSSLIKLTFKTKINNIDIIFQNMYLLNNKKVKNALEESLIKCFNINKKESKKLINSLELEPYILEKQFSVISNEELNILYNKISKMQSSPL